MKDVLVCFCFLLGFTTLKGQDTLQGKMKTYTFVMLTIGTERSQDSITVAKIQKGHMDHMSEMEKSGYLNVAGPFLDDGIWRGIFIFNTTDTAMVRKMVEKDPAVKSGRLNFEMHPWMTMQGIQFK
jgi:uncharacterized protein